MPLIECTEKVKWKTLTQEIWWYNGMKCRRNVNLIKNVINTGEYSHSPQIFESFFWKRNSLYFSTFFFCFLVENWIYCVLVNIVMQILLWSSDQNSGAHYWLQAGYSVTSLSSFVQNFNFKVEIYGMIFVA